MADKFDPKTTQRFVDEKLRDFISNAVTVAPKTGPEFAQAQHNISVSIYGELEKKERGAKSNDDYNEHMNLSATDANGNTALHGLAHITAPNAFKKFADAGVNVNAQNAQGQTPLHMLDVEFVKRFPEEAAQIVKTAREHGADFSITSKPDFSGTIDQTKDGVSVARHLADISAALKAEVAASKANFDSRVEALKNGFQEKNSDLVSNTIHNGSDTAFMAGALMVKDNATAAKYQKFTDSLPVLVQPKTQHETTQVPQSATEAGSPAVSEAGRGPK